MNAVGLRGLANEARGVVQTMRHERSASVVGPVVVSGMLAEQLAREVGDGAVPGAVIFGEGLPSAGAEVLVHVIAGEPTGADEELVRVADDAGIPVVIVQLWPQADWTRPYVLSPFVIECRTGEGFPVREIAERIAEASPNAPLLASRIPELKDAVNDGVVRQTVARTALLSLAGARKGSLRPLIVLEQVRMLSQLRVATTGSSTSEESRVIAGGVGLALASGFAFRTVARAARRVLPEPVADVAVAAGGTWALAKALRMLEARIPHS